MSKIDGLVKSLNKQFKKDIVTKGGEIPERTFIPFSSPSLNYLSRGGVCEGKLIEFYGKEGSAKTTLALDIIKNFQELYPERSVVYLDAENTLNQDWATKLGVNMDEVLVIKPENECGEVLLDMVDATITSGEVGLVIIDSIPFITTKQEFENDLDKKTYGGNSAVITTWCRKVIPLMNKYNTTVICINQPRAVIGSMFPTTDTPGGKMLKHSYVQRFEMRKHKYFDEKGVELNNNAETPQGHTVQVKLEKNKVTKNDRKVSTFTLNYTTGIDVLKDTVDLAVYLGIIAQSGAWFSFMYNEEEYKYQGRSRLVDDLKSNNELLEFIKSEVAEHCLQQ